MRYFRRNAQAHSIRCLDGVRTALIEGILEFVEWEHAGVIGEEGILPVGLVGVHGGRHKQAAASRGRRGRARRDLVRTVKGDDRQGRPTESGICAAELSPCGMGRVVMVEVS